NAQRSSSVRGQFRDPDRLARLLAQCAREHDLEAVTASRVAPLAPFCPIVIAAAFCGEPQFAVGRVPGEDDLAAGAFDLHHALVQHPVAIRSGIVERLADAREDPLCKVVERGFEHVSIPSDFISWPSTMLRRIAVLILPWLLAACGAKGPLYLPPAKAGTPPAPVAVPPDIPPPATSTGPA